MKITKTNLLFYRPNARYVVTPSGVKVFSFDNVSNRNIILNITKQRAIGQR